MGRRPSTRITDSQFGSFIKGLWKAKFPELSGRKLAKKLEISSAYFFDIINGKMPAPSKEIVMLFADVLDYDKDILLGMAGHAEPGTFTVVEMSRPFGLPPMQLVKYDASTLDGVIGEMREEGIVASDTEMKHLHYILSNLNRYEKLRKAFFDRLSNQSQNSESSIN